MFKYLKKNGSRKCNLEHFHHTYHIKPTKNDLKIQNRIPQPNLLSTSTKNTPNKYKHYYDNHKNYFGCKRIESKRLLDCAIITLT